MLTAEKVPTGSGTLRADLMKAHLAPEGWVRTIEAQGNVQGKSENGEVQADSGNVEMWPRVNQAKLLTLRGNVHVNQRDPKTQTGAENWRPLSLQLNFAGGKPGEPNPVQHAETSDRGTMEWSDTPTSQSKLSADKLAVDFGAAGKAKDLTATGNVETQRDLKGRPTQTATAANGDAQLDAGGAWTQMTLRGNVHMKEGDRSADAQQAVFARGAADHRADRTSRCPRREQRNPCHKDHLPPGHRRNRSRRQSALHGSRWKERQPSN